MKIRRLSMLVVVIGAALLVMLTLSAGLYGVGESRTELVAPNEVSTAHAAGLALLPKMANSSPASSITFTLAFTAYLPTVCKDYRDCMQLTKLEADYITTCQYISSGAPAQGAINNVFGAPTWVVPSENAMAILGLKMASEILSDTSYMNRAQLAADYLIRIQALDGSWYNQYSYVTPVDLNRSPRQTAEVMMALYKLGYDHNRYSAMTKGAQYLMECQKVSNKGGIDDGLLGGGKNAQGQYQSWRWTHDNAYAYWALRAAASWATEAGDISLASMYALSAQRIITGINIYLYDPSVGVWHMAVDANGNPQWDACHSANLPGWIQYSPQMLDLPANGANSPRVGEWIHNAFQQGDGSVIGYEAEPNSGECTTRKYPGLSFQAAMSWVDTSHVSYTNSAFEWAQASGLWQTATDTNGIAGGWIDWIEVAPNSGKQADEWQRFIDTSFYAIATCNGGYDFGLP